MNMSKCLIWLFGRGASAACGLTWIVPKHWYSIDRDKQVEMIKAAMRQEMNSQNINTSPYKNLLIHLKKTTNRWHHRFVTTNWDYLLQKEINEMGFSIAPIWLPETGVYHLNGSVEDFVDDRYRSDFLLETDSASVRRERVEANIAFNHILWTSYFIIIGMSFSCEMDRSFFYAISKHQDNVPICKST